MSESITTAPESSIRKRPGRAIIVAGALLVTACSGTEQPHPPSATISTSEAPTASSVGPTSTAATAANKKPCVLPQGVLEYTERTTQGAVQLSTLVGTAPRLGDHGTDNTCYESVVFPLAGKTSGAALPGVHAEYVSRPVTQDPSDQEVAVKGNALLKLTIGSAYDSAGPLRVSSSPLERVQEVVQAGNFESVTSWVIGLDAQHPFTVTDIRSKDCPDLCIAVNIEDPQTAK